MPAPIKHPDWATDGVNTVEPPAGKVAAGWVPGEQPPAGWFNWWQNLVGLWTRWLDTTTIDLLNRVGTLESGHAGLAGDAALKSEENTFTKTQIINASDVWEPLIKSARLATDGSVPAATWRMLWDVPLITGVNCRAYYGSGTAGDGNFCITINAAYSPDTANKWYADNIGIDASVMFMKANRTWFAFQPAGPASWLTWPQGGAVEGAAFNYQPAQSITKAISPMDFIHNSSTNLTFSNEGEYAVFAPSDSGLYVVRVPHGSVLTSTRVKLRASPGDAQYSIKLKRRHSVNWGALTGAVHQTIDTETGTVGDGLVFNEDLDWAAQMVDKAETYEIYVQCTAGPGSLLVNAIEYTYTDPGPRNH